MAKPSKAAEVITEATQELQDGATFVPYTPDCPIDMDTMLDTGIGTLNLAIAGRYYGGIPRGTCVRYSGKASSGKSFNLMSMAACAANDPRYKKYTISVDDVEDGWMMDMNKFGSNLRKRLTRLPKSETLEEAYHKLMDIMEQGPCIHFIDSLDALSSKAEQTKTTKRRKAKTKEAQDELKGDYGDGKAKLHSSMLRQLEPLWVKTGSIVVLVSQYRDDLKSMTGQGKESGGRALEHYPSIHVRTESIGRITKSVYGLDRHIGNMVKATVSKTRVVGGGGNNVTFPLYFESGIDDIGAAIIYLIRERHWKGDTSKVAAPEFGFEGTFEDLVLQLQDRDDARQTLDTLCTRRWHDIREKLSTGRKPRFA